MQRPQIKISAIRRYVCNTAISTSICSENIFPRQLLEKSERAGNSLLNKVSCRQPRAEMSREISNHMSVFAQCGSAFIYRYHAESDYYSPCNLASDQILSCLPLSQYLFKHLSKLIEI